MISKFIMKNQAQKILKKSQQILLPFDPSQSLNLGYIIQTILPLKRLLSESPDSKALILF